MKVKLNKTGFKEKNLQRQNGFSLLEILISLCITCLLMIIAINWLIFIQNNHQHQTNYYAIERALFDQLEAYPEKLSLKDLNLNQSLIDNWVDKIEINTTRFSENCQNVTVSILLKKPMFSFSTKTHFQQQRLFCGKIENPLS